MKYLLFRIILLLIAIGNSKIIFSQNPVITGELKTWHKITITFDGPSTSELDNTNPFTFYLLNVTFTQGSNSYTVPGYFAADGDAANTSNSSGNKWRVHFNPPSSGTWQYSVSFRKGTDIIASDDPLAGVASSPLDGTTGSFFVSDTDKSGKDFRGQGWLEHLNEFYYRFKGTGKYFLKNGTNSPENFLAYWEFDNTQDHSGGLATNLPDGLHHYAPHLNDWITGDVTWQNDKGKGIIGAVNYLSSEEVNAIFMLTMNVNGDGREIYPWTSYSERKRFDVSKLDQWEIVFGHMQKKGIAMHIVLQESENDNLLNSGNLGLERKVYYRELIARFAHHNVLFWNLGEENNRTATQLKADAAYFKRLDPYKHPIKVHSKAGTTDAENLYNSLLGDPNYDATSFQQKTSIAHSLPPKWRKKSSDAGFKWVIEHDEASGGVLPDNASNAPTNQSNLRKNVLWGNYMGGGGGVEWFFPYNSSLAIDDIDCEDFRSRDHFWDYGRYALQFYQTLPFYEMESMDFIITNNSTNWVFGKLSSKIYLVYLSNGGSATITLPSGDWKANWFNPRTGTFVSSENLISGKLLAPDKNDWVVLVQDVGHGNEPVVILTSPVDGAIFPPSSNITIGANATDSDGGIAKVDFYQNGIFLGTDNVSPYTFIWNNVSTGNYTISAIATDNSSATGVDSIHITVGPLPPKVLLSFTLIDASTDLPIPGFDPISNNSVINLGITGKSLNIISNTNGTNIGSVKFELDGKSFRTENVAPYALAGDNSGNYNSWTPALGVHHLLAKAYSGESASGTLIDTLSIDFTISNSSSRVGELNELITDSLIVFPNPFSDEFTFVIQESEKIEELILINSRGEQIDVKYECPSKHSCKVLAGNLSPGLYQLRARTEFEEKILRVIKK